MLLRPFAYDDPARIVMFGLAFQKIFQTGTAIARGVQLVAANDSKPFQEVSAYTIQRRQFDWRSFPEAYPSDAGERGLFPAVRRECATWPHFQGWTTSRGRRRRRYSPGHSGSGTSGGNFQVIVRRMILNPASPMKLSAC